MILPSATFLSALLSSSSSLLSEINRGRSVLGWRCNDSECVRRSSLRPPLLPLASALSSVLSSWCPLSSLSALSVGLLVLLLFWLVLLFLLLLWLLLCRLWL